MNALQKSYVVTTNAKNIPLFLINLTFHTLLGIYK